jgi:hypothetical protein
LVRQSGSRCNPEVTLTIGRRGMVDAVENPQDSTVESGKGMK